MNTLKKRNLYLIIAAALVCVAIIITSVCIAMSRDKQGDNDTTAESDSSSNSTADDTTGEDTTGEDTTGEDSTGEDTTGEDTDEDTTADDTTEGDTTADNTPSDDTTADDTTADDTTADDTTEVVECTHSWRDATCLTAKTCKLCGETSGSVPGHNYTEATCTKKATCKVCGATTGGKLKHEVYDTCVNISKADVCNDCGMLSTWSSVHHSFVNGICSVCGLNWSDYIETNATVVDSKTGETITVEMALALLNKNPIGTIGGDWNDTIMTVVDLKIDGENIRVCFSDGSGKTVSRCDYCGTIDCPGKDSENCPEYNVAEDPTETCEYCGLPKGNGWNGTCKELYDWDGGTGHHCNHWTEEQLAEAMVLYGYSTLEGITRDDVTARYVELVEAYDSSNTAETYNEYYWRVYTAQSILKNSLGR